MWEEKIKGGKECLKDGVGIEHLDVLRNLCPDINPSERINVVLLGWLTRGKVLDAGLAGGKF